MHLHAKRQQHTRTVCLNGEKRLPERYKVQDFLPILPFFNMLGKETKSNFFWASFSFSVALFWLHLHSRSPCPAPLYPTIFHMVIDCCLSRHDDFFEGEKQKYLPILCALQFYPPTKSFSKPPSFFFLICPLHVKMYKQQQKRKRTKR